MGKIDKVNVVLTNEQKIRLTKEASLRDRSLSALCRLYIMKGLKEDEEKRG